MAQERKETVLSTSGAQGLALAAGVSDPKRGASAKACCELTLADRPRLFKGAVAGGTARREEKEAPLWKAAGRDDTLSQEPLAREHFTPAPTDPAPEEQGN